MKETKYYGELRIGMYSILWSYSIFNETSSFSSFGLANFLDHRLKIASLLKD